MEACTRPTGGLIKDIMSNTVQNGKGSKPRPVDKKKYDENFDSIKWSKTTSSITTKKNKK